MTGRPTHLKRYELAEIGIPLLEAKAKFPRDIQKILPEEFSDANILEKLAKLVKETYQERNFKLFGKFTNKHNISPENQRRYETLKTYEEQCDELRREITKLTTDKNEKKNQVSQLSTEIKALQEKLTYLRKEEICCEKTKAKADRVDDLQADFDKQTSTISQQAKELEQQLKRNSQLETELKKIKQRSFWERLFNK